MRFVIAGKMSGRRSKIIKSLEAIKLPVTSKRLELPIETAISAKETQVIKNTSVPNMYLYLDTYSSVRLSAEQWMAANILNYILNESMNSKIYGRAREQGLVYFYGAGFSERRSSTSWWYGSQVSQSKAPMLVDIMVEELTKILSGDLPQSDIDAAKSHALGSFQRSGQTVGGTMAGYSGWFFFDDRIDDFYLQPERIKAVTKDQVIEVCKLFFAEKVWSLGALGTIDKTLLKDLKSKLSTLYA
jgi:predicted Zn-dependent peptidase